MRSWIPKETWAEFRYLNINEMIFQYQLSYCNCFIYLLSHTKCKLNWDILPLSETIITVTALWFLRWVRYSRQIPMMHIKPSCHREPNFYFI